jgi:hypothetical protein
MTPYYDATPSDSCVSDSMLWSAPGLESIIIIIIIIIIIMMIIIFTLPAQQELQLLPRTPAIKDKQLKSYN